MWLFGLKDPMICIFTALSPINRLIIQHKFYSDICIEITHNISIFSLASYHYLSLTWITTYCCETNVFWLIFDGKPACIEIFACRYLNASSSAYSCACPRHDTTIKCTFEQKWACNAFNYYAVRCSLPKQAPKWCLVACIDILRILIKIIPNIESTKYRINDTPTNKLQRPRPMLILGLFTC